MGSSNGCEGKKETLGGQEETFSLLPDKTIISSCQSTFTSLSSPDSTGSGRSRRRPSVFSQIRPSFHRVNPPSHLSVLQTLQGQGDQGGDLQSSPQIRPSFHRVNPPSHLSVLQTL